jgi:hypothetical protein
MLLPNETFCQMISRFSSWVSYNCGGEVLQLLTSPPQYMYIICMHENFERKNKKFD